MITKQHANIVQPLWAIYEAGIGADANSEAVKNARRIALDTFALQLTTNGMASAAAIQFAEAVVGFADDAIAGAREANDEFEELQAGVEAALAPWTYTGSCERLSA